MPHGWESISNTQLPSFIPTIQEAGSHEWFESINMKGTANVSINKGKFYQNMSLPGSNTNLVIWHPFLSENDSFVDIQSFIWMSHLQIPNLMTSIIQEKKHVISIHYGS